MHSGPIVPLQLVMAQSGAAVGASDVRISLVDSAVAPGATVEGVVCGLGGYTSGAPFELRYACEEQCRRAMFSDSRLLTSLAFGATGARHVRRRSHTPVRTQLALSRDGSVAAFAFPLPATAPPNFVGVYDGGSYTMIYSATHSVTLYDNAGRALARAWLNVTAPPQDKAAQEPPPAQHMERALSVLPRVQLRYGPVILRCAALTACVA